MKLRSLAGLVAAAVLTTAPAAIAAPANVSVRAEGGSATVVPRTAVTTTTAPVNKDGQHDCSGTSAAGAIEQATGGDWGGTWFDGLGYSVDRVRGEASNPSGTFWAFWVNYRPSDVGVCGAELQAGDEVLLFIDCFAGCPSRTPLRLSGVPAVAAPGAATVRVETFEVSGSTTTPVPAPDATVQVGGRSFTTGGDGTAQVTFEGSGPVSVLATKAGHVPSATEQACVSSGSDGACGSATPQPSGPVAGADTLAPAARIAGIRDGQRFSRRRAPRVLRGAVAEDPSGLRAVKLRLSRRLGRACWYFSGRRERFLRRRCGTRNAFRIGDRAEWSYLLPARLPRGRYVLEVYAIDRAGNRTATERGTNRVAFEVR